MKRVLDLGCGTGDRSKNAKPNTYIGIDIDHENIAIAQKKYPNASWIQKDITQIKISDLPAVSRILCIEVIEHIPKWEQVFNVLQDAAPGTKLLLTTPHHLSEQKLLQKNPSYWKEIGHCNMFTKKMLYDVLYKAGYADISITRTNAALYFELSRLFHQHAPCIRNTYYENNLSFPEKIFWQLFRTDLFSTKLRWFFPLWIITLPCAYLILNPLFGATWRVNATKK